MHLVEMVDGVRGKVFPIQEGNNLIGRWDPDSGAYPDIDLEDVDPEAKVSRKHAIIYLKGDQIEVEDLNSLNGTFINRGKGITAGIKYKLSHGDELVIGKTFFILENE